MNPRSIWSLIATVALSFGAFSADGATIVASSTSLTDVSNAVVSASHGDTVRIPAGSSTWASELYVTKAISIIGAGTNATHITATNTLAIWWKPSTNLPIRVSSIRFTSGYGSECIYFEGQRENPGSGRVPITSFRVDRCLFTGGKRTIWPIGWVYGVVDHNLFLNCDIAVSPQGDNSASWARAEGYGTTNAVVIEDNDFVVNNSAPYEPNEQIYHYEGARSVTRFNRFDFTSATSYNGLPFESHGNYGSSIADPGTTNVLALRGQPVVEIYGNTMAVHHTYRFIYLRSGSGIIASNTMTWASGSTPVAISLTDEEAWQTLWFSPLKTTWPGHDGITNSFYWANTLNGSPITVSVTGPDTNVIQVNRDYWLQAPNSTNGSPAGILQGYATLTYPHPLATAQDGTSRVFRTTTARVGTVSSP